MPWPPAPLDDTKLPSTPTVGDHAATHDAVADVANATVAILGPAPQGTYATVTDRLASAAGVGALLANNNLGDLPNPAAGRTALGLGTSATHPAGDFLQTANNLSDGTAATMRTNLGLGTVATHPLGDLLQTANNLSDITSQITARNNLGLGTIATHPTTDFVPVTTINATPTSFTPTWSCANDPQPDIGNGQIRGWYWNLGNLWVIAWTFNFGSTTAYGTDTNTNYHWLSFPPGFSASIEQVAPALYGASFGQYHGKAWFHTNDSPYRLFLGWPKSWSHTHTGAAHTHTENTAASYTQNATTGSTTPGAGGSATPQTLGELWGNGTGAAGICPASPGSVDDIIITACWLAG